MTEPPKKAMPPSRGEQEDTVANPKAAFRHPMEVVRTTGLPRADKQKALEAWEEDERALQRATEEGMGGGQAPRVAEVQKAERALAGGGGGRSDKK